MSYRRSPWYRRHARWLYALVGLLAFVAIRISYDRIRTDIRPDRNVTLEDGVYEILSVRDPITFVCKKTTADAEPIVVRLLGVRLPNIGQTADDRLRKRAEQKTLEFIESNRVSLRFDRHRFDVDDTALAFLIVDEKVLNVELLQSQLVEFRAVPGVPSALQRKLNKVAEFNNVDRY